MAQLQITDFLQAVRGTYFTADDKPYSHGWHVPQDDWKQLFREAYDDPKGHKMWMMASDGARLTGPYGVRCWQAKCTESNFAGKFAFTNKPCSDDHGGFWGWQQRDGRGELLNPAQMKMLKWNSTDVVSCSKYFAPELNTYSLELGLSPDNLSANGVTQYPYDPTPNWRLQPWLRHSAKYHFQVPPLRGLGEPDSFIIKNDPQGREALAKCKPADESCIHPISVVRPRVALKNVYRPGSFFAERGGAPCNGLPGA